MTPLRIALLGCGRIASAVHLSVLTRLPQVRLTAFAEADPGRRAAARVRLTGAREFEDWEQLLSQAEVDAVVIALPPVLHAPAALAALPQGRHLYLEKPLATTLEDGKRVVEVWRRAQVVGRIGFNFRFHAAHRAARERIRAGALGEVLEVRSCFATRALELPDWKRAEEGGGALADLGPHHIDLCRFLLGREVVEVMEAQAISRESALDDVSLTLRLEDGAVLRSRFRFGVRDEDRIEVLGSRGSVVVDRLRQRPLLDRLLAPTRERSYEAALADFVRAARAGQGDGPDLADGLASLAVVAAALECVRSRRPTPVTPLP